MNDTKIHPSRRPLTGLFFISFLILFFELAVIRWFGSYVVFLTFFTNVILLASFLGMSVGCLAAGRKRDYVNLVPILMGIGVVAAVAIMFAYVSVSGLAVDVGGQDSPQRVYFGTEYRPPDLAAIVIPREVIAGFFFALIALMFIGPGQVLGRHFDMIPNRVKAYSVNIVGSLAGIVAFAAISYISLSPFWWFLIALGIACCFYTGTVKRRFANYVLTILIIAFVGLLGKGIGLSQVAGLLDTEVGRRLEQQEIRWSPYYIIKYNKANRSISVNNIGHQRMGDTEDKGVAYSLPYFLREHVGGDEIKSVLIIGAGSGNDVSSACLRDYVERIDAVEIDPEIYEIGREHHPRRPYQDPRVHIYINDGRNFLKITDRKYDLIVYALVDSLVIHSGYSSIRLESYLFTRQAFEDVKSCLNPGGMFVVYNYFRQEWIVGRIEKTTKEVFGKDALVIPMTGGHYEQSAKIGDAPKLSKTGGYTMVVLDDSGAINRKFKENKYFLMPKTGFADTSGAGFDIPVADESEYVKMRPVAVTQPKLLPEDSWPFLYLAKRQIPWLTLRGMAMMAVLSAIILFFFLPRKKAKMNWTMFFLGAGFMLLETKGVVQFALLFGSTWYVNSIVFFAILVMILIANLYVIKFKPERLMPYYVALTAMLVLNIFVGLEVFLGMSATVRIVGSCLLFFAPVFFAGVIFASYFRKSRNPDTDMGANIAGIVLGGLAENLSLMLGFNHLLWVAIGFYLLARVFKGRLAGAAA